MPSETVLLNSVSNSVHPAASRSTLQIQSPTPSHSIPQIYTPTISASRSTLQTYSPTVSSPNLLHPHSASASRLSPDQPRSPNSSTSDISLVHLPSATTSTTKLLHSNSAKTSKLSPAHLPTSPYVLQRRHRPRWLRWAPDFEIDERVLALSVTITLAIMVLLGVPLGAILPQRYVVQLPVNVLVLFYVYPELGGWDRLYHAAIKRPDTNFTVILNIDNGPGSSTWPAGEWVGPIKKLNVFGNVRTIGYIDTEGGKRDNATVRKEIAAYAGWNKSGIAIHGIYFDRTPFSDTGDARAYLKNISATVRHEEGFLEPTLVVQNPGVVPDASLTSYHADVTVVFEGEYEDLPKREDMHEKLKTLGGRREDYAYMVHSLPDKVARGGIRKIVDGARRDVQWLYVTDQTGEGKYGGYSGRWEEFLDLIW